MNILFVHNNFPAQFRHVAALLAERPENRVAAIGSSTAKALRGVALQLYAMRDSDSSGAHPFARRFDNDCRRAEQIMYATSGLTRSGFDPHVVVGHTGWGEMLPVREIFPRARVIGYGEFYYRTEGQDAGFDHEFPDPGRDARISMHIKNAATVTSLLDCDAAITPTIWQRSTFPVELHSKFKVLHEGVRTDLACPRHDAALELEDGTKLIAGDEVVTFVARNLEPTRGYHVFMRSLPIILRKRPNAHVLIVGGNGTSYGAGPPAGQTWQQKYFNEVSDKLDTSRVHFLGRLTYQRYLKVLQVSAAHIYLTYPFVLSWSMLEAMSAGCVIIGSDTGPVSEVITNDKNGVLVPFFDAEAIAERAVHALRSPKSYIGLREAARETALSKYSADRLSLDSANYITRG